MPDQPTPSTVDEALLALQSDPPRLVKDQAGQVGNQKTKYADLIQANEVILPRLTALGLLWTTAPTMRMLPDSGEKDGPRFVLDWELLHVASGTRRQGAFPLPPNANPMQNGSAITYARRYALLAITNAVAEDDDDDGRGYRGREGMAQRASARQQPAAQPTAQRAAPAPRAERARPAQQPPLPEPAQQRPGAVDEPTPKQLGMMRAQLAKMDVTDAADVYALLGDMVGRPLTSTKQITKAEATGLIDAMVEANSKYGERALIALPDLYQGPRRGRREAAAPPADEGGGQQRSRTASEALGIGASPGNEPAPWESGEAPPDDGWPDTATPGGDDR